MPKRRPRLSAWLIRPLAILLTYVMNSWLATLSMRVWRYDPASDPGDSAYSGPAIYAFWHEYLLLPLYLRPRCSITMLISRNRDADILNHIAPGIGMEVIRGSTNRGATAALRQLIFQGSGKNLAIVPDGPLGPRRQFTQGCIYLSSRLQIPIVLVAIGLDRPWRIQRAWDKFAIPKPFRRARVIMGPRIQVPADLDRAAIEQHRQWFEHRLKELTLLAEQWAENQVFLPGSELLYRHGPRQLSSNFRRSSSSDTGSASHSDRGKHAG